MPPTYHVSLPDGDSIAVDLSWPLTDITALLQAVGASLPPPLESYLRTRSIQCREPAPRWFEVQDPHTRARRIKRSFEALMGAGGAPGLAAVLSHWIGAPA